jgi:uncharacterized damage-inducible protein DinB
MSAAPNPNTTSLADREMLLDLLRVSRERFLGSFAGVRDEHCRRRPADGAWSVLETVEHLTVAEKTMLKIITGPRQSRAADAPNREAVFLRAVSDRSRKMESPEIAKPCGRFANLQHAASEFKTGRESVMRFLRETNEDLRATEVKHPHPAAGHVSTFEMIIIIAKHAERHALQIEEIKNSPVFRAQTLVQG